MPNTRTLLVYRVPVAETANAEIYERTLDQEGTTKVPRLPGNIDAMDEILQMSTAVTGGGDLLVTLVIQRRKPAQVWAG